MRSTGLWTLRSTVGAAFPIYVDGTLALTLSASGAATAAGAFGVTGALGVTGNTTLSTLAATKAYGAAPAGTSQPFVLTTTFSGDAGGTTDARGLNLSMTASGANSIARLSGFNNNISVTASAGTVAIANLMNGSMTVTGNAAVTLLRLSDITAVFGTGSASVTDAQVYYGRITRTSGTAAVTTARVFYADDSGGAYSTNAFGYDAAVMSAAATLTANYRAQNTAGTGRWGFYGSGTALNAFAAGVRIGSVVAPVAMLDVTGNIAATTTYQSGAPAGSSAGLWKFGALQSGAVVVDTTRSVYVDIGGVVYHLIVST